MAYLNIIDENNLILEKDKNGDIKAYRIIVYDNGKKRKDESPIVKGSLVSFVREIDYSNFILNFKKFKDRFGTKYGNKAVFDTAVVYSVSNYPSGMDLKDQVLYYSSDTKKYMARLTMATR